MKLVFLRKTTNLSGALKNQGIKSLPFGHVDALLTDDKKPEDFNRPEGVVKI